MNEARTRAKVGLVVKSYFAQQELTTERIQWAVRAIALGLKIGSGPSKSELRKHLTRLIGHERKLYDAIKSMPSDLSSILSGGISKSGLTSYNWLLNPLSPRQVLCQEVKRLGDIFSEADKRLAPKLGRPNSEPAASVTMMAAVVFEALTGRQATPGYNVHTDERSPFEQFLAKIFEALGIDANTERQAKSLRDKMKKK